MKSNKLFQKSYKLLNDNQKQAVDTIDGPVMVVAGPGTGKTQTIALRIANILTQTDTDPDAILALTFTESGAKAMRDRLSQIIGNTAYYVNIFTFHGFCAQLIRDNPDHFTIEPSSEPLSELEKFKIINEILDKNHFKRIKPSGSVYHYSKAIMSSISDLKREAVSPENFKDLNINEESFLTNNHDDLTKTQFAKREKDLEKNQELQKVYKLYQKRIDIDKRYDFEDMINTVIESLSTNKDLLMSYQERFHYFLVDEFQDSNNSQNNLLLLLSSHWGQAANVFVVGDPDQSIYRFQGASIENQLAFIKNFPKAKVVALYNNYRSNQNILDIAESLISHNNLRINDVVSGIKLGLNSNTKENNKISLANFSSDLAELIFVASDIKNKIERGAKPEEISIIYRTNKEAEAISNILSKWGVDYIIQGGANVLDTPVVINFLKILRVINEMRLKQEDEDFFTILHYDIFENDPLDVLKVSRLAAEKRLSLFDVLEDESLLQSIKLKKPKYLQNTLSQLAEYSRIDANITFPEFFETVLNNTGYLKYLLDKPDAHHEIAKINTIFDEAKRMSKNQNNLKLKDFLENIDIMQENNLRLEESNFGKSPECITLTTAHSAKGLEWDHVYILKLADKNWGNNRSYNLFNLPESIVSNLTLDKKEKNEDERRLFYVALTRARKSLTLTFADSYSSYGTKRNVSQSMFLGEIGDSHINKVDTSPAESNAHKHLEKVLSTKEVKIKNDEKDFLNKIISKFSLSPTALNTYLECAYKFKLDKLLRVPRSKKAHLAFGTAVHSALEEFYNQIQNNYLPKENEFISYFESALKKEVISEKDYQIRLQEGYKILSSYYQFYKKDCKKPLFLEKYFRVQLEDITLSGKLDRIEWFDSKKRLVSVTDYKTGKPKTKGQIEGSTKDSRGDLKRQLVFYRLLIDLDRRLKNITFHSAELDFVSSPSISNKSGKKRVIITKDEVNDLIIQIKKVMGDIRSQNFKRTTDYSICAKCAFKDHCWPEGIPSN